MVMYFREDSNSNPFQVFNSAMKTFVTILEIFDEICVNVFRFGNWILFLIFLAMGLNLLITAKEKENRDKIRGRNLEYVQKRGRAGSVVFIFLGIGFLFKGLAIFLIMCFQSSLPPPIFRWLNIAHLYGNIISLEDLQNYDIFEASLFLFISLLSFVSLILISFGIYLILFNKRVLRTKYKSYSFFILGVIMGIVCGFTSGLLLTI